jgi:hypothetical protein
MGSGILIWVIGKVKGKKRREKPTSKEDVGFSFELKVVSQDKKNACSFDIVRIDIGDQVV